MANSTTEIPQPREYEATSDMCSSTVDSRRGSTRRSPATLRDLAVQDMHDGCSRACALTSRYTAFDAERPVIDACVIRNDEDAEKLAHDEMNQTWITSITITQFDLINGVRRSHRIA